MVIDRHKEARKNKEKSQNYHKQDADNRRNATKSMIIVGDTVIVKEQLRKKLTTRFNETPYRVISRKGTRVVAENGKGHLITRNVSFFKKFNADEVKLAVKEVKIQKMKNTGQEQEIMIAKRKIKCRKMKPNKKGQEDNDIHMVWLSHSFTVGKMNINKRFRLTFTF